MYISVRNLRSMPVLSIDGRIGSVSQAFFDDVSWAIRFIVVTLDDEWGGRSILVTPADVETVDEENSLVRLRITTSQAVNCPDVDSSMPDFRRKKGKHARFAADSRRPGSSTAFFRTGIAPVFFEQDVDEEPMTGERPADFHLRSSGEVLRYGLRARDCRFGHVEDFIFDDHDWLIRQIKVTVRVGTLRRKALLSPLWVTNVSWPDREVLVDLPAEAIRAAPKPGTPQKLINNYETWLLSIFSLPMESTEAGTRYKT